MFLLRILPPSFLHLLKACLHFDRESPLSSAGWCIDVILADFLQLEIIFNLLIQFNDTD